MNETRSGAGATPQQDLTDEEQCRAFVRAMFETPEGRAAAEALFSPLSRMTKAEREAAVERYALMRDRRPAA